MTIHRIRIWQIIYIEAKSYNKSFYIFGFDKTKSTLYTNSV